jgi:hypothetical protein
VALQMLDVLVDVVASQTTMIVISAIDQTQQIQIHMDVIERAAL